MLYFRNRCNNKFTSCLHKTKLILMFTTQTYKDLKNRHSRLDKACLHEVLSKRVKKMTIKIFIK